MLKVQFPIDTRHEPDRAIWVDACEELNEASPVPWALLSGGDPFDLFLAQVEVACAAGASGFMVGRALWREAVTARAEDRERIVAEIVRPRFRRLADTARASGRDWAQRHDLPNPDERWYPTY